MVQFLERQIMKPILQLRKRVIQIMCGVVSGEVLYNILIKIDTHMKLVRLIKTCLNEIDSRVLGGTSD
jgi:hypothetical protein